MAPKMIPATSQPKNPHPFTVNALAKHFGMTCEQVCALALMEAMAEQHQHQPRQIGPATWEMDSRTEPGTVRTVTQAGNRLLCDCPAANRTPRLCTHTASVHVVMCRNLGIEPPVRPLSPWVLRHDPSPEARAALVLIARPHQPKPPAERPATDAPRTKVRKPAEVLR